METLNRKFYGLKAWQWVAVVGMGAFVFFRLRSGGGSATDTLGGAAGNQDATAGGQGYGQGFEQGYGQGFYAGAINPSTPTPAPPPGSKNCRPMKDPSGKSHTVCGSGHWVNLSAPGKPIWQWVEGSGKTIYGVGKKGRLFYNPPPTRTRKKKEPARGSGKIGGNPTQVPH